MRTNTPCHSLIITLERIYIIADGHSLPIYIMFANGACMDQVLAPSNLFDTPFFLFFLRACAAYGFFRDFRSMVGEGAIGVRRFQIRYC